VTLTSVPIASLSIVLPAYNEEFNIRAAVEAAQAAADDLQRPYEIIVVDDGSADRTAECVTAIGAADARVRLVSFPENRGYGAALRAGFRAARGDLIFYTDADLQFDVRELRYFLPLMSAADVALGFRVYRYDAVLRCILSWMYNRLVGVLFRVRVRDVDCSFKLMRREVLERIDLETTDFFIDTELVAKARKWNFRIVEKGVRHYPRMAGQSTVRPGDIPRTLRTVGRMWARLYVRLPSKTHQREPVCPHDHDPIPAEAVGIQGHDLRSSAERPAKANHAN
jgi:glycosyltransferase involved in cell wall biosynthesis